MNITHTPPPHARTRRHMAMPMTALPFLAPAAMMGGVVYAGAKRTVEKDLGTPARLARI
jgi:hypothetical protein